MLILVFWSSTLPLSLLPIPTWNVGNNQNKRPRFSRSTRTESSLIHMKSSSWPGQVQVQYRIFKKKRNAKDKNYSKPKSTESKLAINSIASEITHTRSKRLNVQKSIVIAPALWRDNAITEEGIRQQQAQESKQKDLQARNIARGGRFRCRSLSKGRNINY